MDIADAKAEIDTLINNARFRCFRPIRVAEILHRSRTVSEVALEEPESYRVESSRWRDEMSRRLTGKASSSSRSYQKDFSDLIDPSSLAELDEVNRAENGLVESYIYHRLKHDKWGSLIAARDYINESAVNEFTFETYMELTTDVGGLQDDALLEIAVYALFNSIAEALDAKAKLEIDNPQPDLLNDFSSFIATFMGLDAGETTFETLVDVHRAGKATYAADKGVDIGTNFGTMVQVKYVTLSRENINDIETNSYVDRVVVVCRGAEKDVIERVSKQLGFERVRAIVTISDLEAWYGTALRSYQDQLGEPLLRHLRSEFNEEYRGGDTKVPPVDDLIAERNYDAIELLGIWEIEAADDTA
ncbi:HaeII family restriction endonuclease [Halonotius terrestris]|uniref:HaeII family restriction endonuclease n=1 Tax=Halonotius terrestris TaxID=2487750 RepID=A0A8J8PBC3_9EURY|nr:HaeII family restriction endonuclease [Halonotius terrestris]TQQ79278.1 HaeII family restriction endonuclease [Halonotius terrestris]